MKNTLTIYEESSDIEEEKLDQLSLSSEENYNILLINKTKNYYTKLAKDTKFIGKLFIFTINNELFETAEILIKKEQIDFVKMFIYVSDSLFNRDINSPRQQIVETLEKNRPEVRKRKLDILKKIADKIEIDKLTIDQTVKLYDYISQDNKFNYISKDFKLIKDKFKEYYDKNYFEAYCSTYYFEKSFIDYSENSSSVTLRVACFLYGLNDKIYFQKFAEKNSVIYYGKENFLCYAAKNGGKKIIKQLLNDPNFGIDINLVDNIGNSFYDYLLKNNYQKIVKLLLNDPRHDLAKQDQYRIECLKKYLLTPIEDSFYIIKLLNHPKLVNSNAINIKNEYGYTILHRAILNYKIDLVRELFQYPKLDINIQDKDGNMALHLIVKNRRNSIEDSFRYQVTSTTKLNLIQELFKHQKFDVNFVNNEGNTALHLAIQLRHISIVRELLKHPKININIKNKQGNTALDLAIGSNHFDLIKEFKGQEQSNIDSQHEQEKITSYDLTKLSEFDLIQNWLKDQKFSRNIEEENSPEIIANFSNRNSLPNQKIFGQTNKR